MLGPCTAESLAGWWALRDNELMYSGLGALAVDRVRAGRLERGTRLLAASHALAEATGWVPSGDDRRPYGQAVMDARATLGEAAFTVAWNAGLAMSTVDAVACALEEDRPDA